MKSLSCFSNAAFVIVLACFFIAATGCQTTQGVGSVAPPEDREPDPNITLRAGDIVCVVFPGAKGLDAAQIIRRDGKIALPTFGEVRAAGLTPAQLEKHILDTFGPQLVSKEVTVTLDSAQYPVFLNGAVMKPGKIEANRPITVLEAIMEAGGFDSTKANLKSVKIIRTQGTQVQTFI